MLIGLGYKKFSGKDAAANVLRTGKGFRCLAFADRLKDAVGLVYGLSERQTRGDRKDVVDPRWGASPAQLFQKWGTEVGRSIDPDLWMKVIKLQIERSAAWCENTVLTDMRFPNEADMVRALGGFAVEVRADEMVRMSRAEALGLSGDEYLARSRHASETALDGYQFDYLLPNNGTLGDLVTAVGVMHDHLLRRTP